MPKAVGAAFGGVLRAGQLSSNFRPHRESPYEPGHRCRTSGSFQNPWGAGLWPASLAGQQRPICKGAPGFSSFVACSISASLDTEIPHPSAQRPPGVCSTSASLDTPEAFPYTLMLARAGVAQQAEQSIRNRQVIGSSPIAGSTLIRARFVMGICWGKAVHAACAPIVVEDMA